MKDQVVSHVGIVKAVEGERVRVLILQASACAGCSARQMCSSAEAKEKEVDVCTRDAARFEVGQEVVLEGRLTDARAASMIAYGLPLLLLLPVLFVGIRLSGSEVVGAVSALAVVAVYYGIVFLFFRRRLQQRFAFHIRH